MQEEEADGTEYLKKHEIGCRQIAHRYVLTLKLMHKFIEKIGRKENIEVNRQALRRAVMDYYADIARIKDYHPIDEISPEKYHAYAAYWLLKRKPMQIKEPYEKCEFANEFFIANSLVSSVLSEKNIDIKKISTNTSFNEFRSLLFYNLKYRPVFQQTLELMIKAFFCGCDIFSTANTAPKQTTASKPVNNT
jgi:hypothetical protein